jgi:hypothetical protein
VGLSVSMSDSVGLAEGLMEGFSEYVSTCVGLSVSNGRGVGLAVNGVGLAVGNTVGRKDEGSIVLSGPIIDVVGAAVDGTRLSLAPLVGCVVVIVGVAVTIPVGGMVELGCDGVRVTVVVAALVGCTVGSTVPAMVGYMVSNVADGMPSTDGAVDGAHVIGGVSVDGVSALSFFPFSCFFFRLSEGSVSST